MSTSWLVPFQKTLGLAVCVAAAGLFTAPAAVAASYPDKLVRVIVPYPAGGPADVMARQVAPALEAELGTTVIVENVGGGGGSIGANRVLRSPADGYQVLLASPMDLIQAPLSVAGANFQSDDFALAGMIINTDLVMIGRKDLPYNTIAELVAGARQPDAKPLTYGSVGYGSLFHLAGEAFGRQTGLEMMHVPYRGGAPVIQDLMGGQIDLTFIPLAGPVLNLIRSGQVKPLALASTERHPLLPELPLVSESQGLEGFAFDIWAALGVPKDTPENVKTTLNDALARALTHTAVRDNLAANGPKVASPSTLNDMAQLYQAEIQRYAELAKAAGVEPQ